MKTEHESDLSEEFHRLETARTLGRPAPPPAAELDFDRVEGMMLGLAVGDSLGITSEGLYPEDRREYLGEIRDYLPHPRTGEPWYASWLMRTGDLGHDPPGRDPDIVPTGYPVVSKAGIDALER